jgi:hypothetical protein
MPAIFSPCLGAIAKVPGCEGEAAFAISFGGGAKLTAPMTGFVLEQNGNYQFLHTVNDFIYVYAFGDRVGELLISGIGFVKACPGADSAKLCTVFDFYQNNKISKKGDLTVSIGDCQDATFFAFLTGMRLEMQDPTTLVGQWSLRFSIVPKK